MFSQPSWLYMVSRCVLGGRLSTTCSAWPVDPVSHLCQHPPCHAAIQYVRILVKMPSASVFLNGYEMINLTLISPLSLFFSFCCSCWVCLVHFKFDCRVTPRIISDFSLYYFSWKPSILMLISSSGFWSKSRPQIGAFYPSLDRANFQPSMY